MTATSTAPAKPQDFDAELSRLAAERATLANRLDDVTVRLDAARRVVRQTDPPTAQQRTHLTAMEAERRTVSGLLTQTDDDLRAVQADRDVAELFWRKAQLLNTVLHTKKTAEKWDAAHEHMASELAGVLELAFSRASRLKAMNAERERARHAAREYAVLCGLHGMTESTPRDAPEESRALGDVLALLGLPWDALLARYPSPLPALPHISEEVNWPTVRREFRAALERAK